MSLNVPPPPATAFQYAANRLRALILSGEWVAGRFIPPEIELQRAFNMSRATIRGAIATLVAEGLLEAQRRLGTQVRSWRHDGAFDMAAARLWQLQGSSDAHGAMEEMLWLRRTFYSELMTRPLRDIDAGAESISLYAFELGMLFEKESMIPLKALLVEEMALCVLADWVGGDTSVLLANSIRRAITVVARRGMAPLVLTASTGMFEALSQALRARDVSSLRDQMRSICELREAAYLALAVSRRSDAEGS